MDARGATIRLRWSRAEMEMPACYKHSAPLEPGGDGNACVLQTFGSAGAGRGWKCLRATNIRLRWSREVMEWPACYKHPAPLEPDGDGMAGCYKHSAPLEPGGGAMLGELRTFGSGGAGRRWNGWGFKHSAPLEP